MTQLAFEKLDVFGVAIDFVVSADAIAGAFGPGRAYLADQLRRASSSVVLNIAEGVGEFARLDKARFYRMALRSAHECGGTLILAERLGLAETANTAHARQLLERVIAMLTQMAKRCSGAGAGAGGTRGRA